MSKQKDIATSFLKYAASGDVKRAYAEYVAADFVHHNQYFAGDRASLMTAMEEAHKTSPNTAFEIKRVVEEGDTVVTHSLVMKAKPEPMAIAVVHIFRFRGGRIVELWDLGQQILKDSPNKNGLF
jgi:predicted SnoaL-like aldol condensation-catalyzing enzyme